MLVDGKAIAADILDAVATRVAALSRPPHLTVFTCAPNFETQMFLRLKQRAAARVGVSVNVIEFPDSIATAEVLHTLAAHTAHTDGFVVQLPFPPSVAIAEVVACIPESKDVDVMTYQGQGTRLPPVVGAIAAIVTQHAVDLTTAAVVIVGQGRFVGRPAAQWCPQATVVTERTQNRDQLIAAADVLILGAGVPGLVQPADIKEGVCIFDAGTSEANGVLRGDADPSCAEKAALMTPVPGGIGPITIAVLLRNLVELTERQ